MGAWEAGEKLGELIQVQTLMPPGQHIIFPKWDRKSLWLCTENDPPGERLEASELLRVSFDTLGIEFKSWWNLDLTYFSLGYSLSSKNRISFQSRLWRLGPFVGREGQAWKAGAGAPIRSEAMAWACHSSKLMPHFPSSLRP